MGKNNKRIEREKEKIYKVEIVNIRKEVKKRAMYPFKTEEAQKSFGFIFSLFGLILLALGINSPLLILSFFGLNFNYSFLGFLFFFIGLFYFIENTLR